MAIPYKQIPSNIRVPLFYAEVDNSQANTATAVQRTLIIGQKLDSGSAAPLVPFMTAGVADAAAQCGDGSMLHLMTDVYRQNDLAGELWLLPLADDASATAAAGSVEFTAVATAAGVFSLYIGGVRVQMSVTTAQTTAQLATALAAAIAATPMLAVTAAVDGTNTSKVNITARNKGLVGNDIPLVLNYLGSAAGEVTPSGLTTTVTQLSGGTINPTLTAALANLASMPFDFIICPYTDTTSLDAVKSMLNDTTGRWSWAQQLYGHCFSALSGTFGALTTFGSGRNNQHESVLGVPSGAPSPAALFAAAYAGAAAVSLRNDPGQPLQTVQFYGVLPPPTQSQFSLPQRNQLLYTGISTFTVAADRSVALENVITTYQTNSYGQPDNSYLEVETMYLLMFVIRFLATRVTSRFARMKLANDGTLFAPGSPIVTPSVIRADQIAAFQELEYRGFVQNSEAFAQLLIVERDSVNVNRINVLWPGALINQLRIFALLAQFRLS